MFHKMKPNQTEPNFDFIDREIKITSLDVTWWF